MNKNVETNIYQVTESGDRKITEMDCPWGSKMAEHAYIDQSMRLYLSAVKINTLPPISSHMDLATPSSTAYICKEEI